MKQHINNAQEAFNELSYYTLSHSDPSFIHQHSVDAFTAQNANENTKPIALVFALFGLYLLLEKDYTGKQVQKAHMLLARKQKQWALISLPKTRGGITVFDVLKTEPGLERDRMINTWCASVWDAYEDAHTHIADLWNKYFPEEL